ncbi:LPS export ABC transporter periplasmic protein LptC [Thalassotalea sp. PLHSN55]|uniref:LPS export ABC transporter periplasmic protein LptC n=1 Tax=Thalassotalea sp. PLHSN55 TaxID=3435888 RepID=UPI003F86D516
MNKLNSLAFSIFLIAVSTYAVLEWMENKDKTAEVISTDLVPEFIAENLQSDIFNEDGQLSYVIDAQRMEHFSDLSLTNFELPRYTLYPKNNSLPWKMSANEATLYDNNRVILKNRVRLYATDKNSLIQEINGKYLELDLNTNIISSEQTILIKGKGFTMYGSGLIVDLNTTQMTLTEHVQTIYKKTTS